MPTHYYAQALATFLRMTLSHKVQQHLSIPLALKETDLTQGMAWLPLVPLSLLFNLNKKVTSPYMRSVSLSIHISGRAESLLSWSPLTPVSLLFTQRLFTA